MLYNMMKGKVVDKNIKLDRLIGEGAFGEIYLGRNMNSGKEYAVKVEKSERKSGLLELEYRMYQHCYKTVE